MNTREIIDFLLPQWSDPIQFTFFIVIALMMAYAIGGAHYAARPSEWEKKWNRGTETTEDDLDIEHGSVTDLWHAVATSHEKLAEIMPGLLLVVGLLGTFLGLGLALNHASNILGQQDAASTSAAASSMNELMGMLKGLGTKFKTSTWGICGFVLLKIWSELTRFEEKRLVWVIDKVKLELHARRNKEEEIGAERQKALFEEIRSAASTIEKAFKTAIKSSTIHTQDFLGKEISKLNASLTAIHSSSQATSESMAAFTQNTTHIVQQMADAAQGMATGADQVSVAAAGLNNAVDDFSNKFTDVLNKVRQDLGSAIQDMSEKSAETMASGSQKLEEATKEISAALESLSGDIKQTLGNVKGSIEKSLEIQKNAFVLFETTSQTLNEQIQKSTQTANMMKDSIESGLQGVSGASRNVGLLSKQMEDVAKKLDGDTLSKVELLSKQIELQSNEIDIYLEKLKRHTSEMDRMASEATQSHPFEIGVDS